MTLIGGAIRGSDEAARGGVVRYQAVVSPSSVRKSGCKRGRGQEGARARWLADRRGRYRA